MYNYRYSWVSEDNVLMMFRRAALKSFGGIVAVALAACMYAPGQTKTGPVDPGVRGGPAGAGTPVKGLTADQAALLQDGLARVAEGEALNKGANHGLRPPFH